MLAWVCVRGECQHQQGGTGPGLPLGGIKLQCRARLRSRHLESIRAGVGGRRRRSYPSPATKPTAKPTFELMVRLAGSAWRRNVRCALPWGKLARPIVYPAAVLTCATIPRDRFRWSAPKCRISAVWRGLICLGFTTRTSCQFGCLAS